MKKQNEMVEAVELPETNREFTESLGIIDTDGITHNTSENLKGINIELGETCPCCESDDIELYDKDYGDECKGEEYICKKCESRFIDWYEFDPAILDGIQDGNEAMEVVDDDCYYKYTTVTLDKNINARIALMEKVQADYPKLPFKSECDEF